MKLMTGLIKGVVVLAVVCGLTGILFVKTSQLLQPEDDVLVMGSIFARYDQVDTEGVGSAGSAGQAVTMQEVLRANTEAHLLLHRSLAEFSRQIHESPPRIKLHMISEHIPRNLLMIAGGIDKEADLSLKYANHLAVNN